MTQQELADETGTTVDWIGTFERGNVERLDMERFFAVAKTLDIAPSNLVDMAWLKKTNQRVK